MRTGGPRALLVPVPAAPHLDAQQQQGPRPSLTHIARCLPASPPPLPQTSLVAAGGVPRLVALLSHANPVISGHALGALSCVADDALAQDAIR